MVRRLTALAVEKDLTQLEINPLALAEGGGFVALDAKMDFDDSALKRHPDVAALKDREEGDPLERAAAEKGLTYVRLGGSHRHTGKRRWTGDGDNGRYQTGRSGIRQLS